VFEKSQSACQVFFGKPVVGTAGAFGLCQPLSLAGNYATVKLRINRHTYSLLKGHWNHFYELLVCGCMRIRVLLPFALYALFASARVGPAQTSPEESIRSTLIAHAAPLAGPGENLLLKEARTHDFFLLGELHGETEIPALLRTLWPQLWQAGYRHVGAELSPWAAAHLEQPADRDNTPIAGLWTRGQAATVRQFAAANEDVVWGCDIEEEQPDRLILDLSKLNPADTGLRQMSRIVSQGYNRKQASELLSLAEAAHPAQDATPGGASLWLNLLDTLRVEAFRSSPTTRFEASETRELVMKRLFLTHYRQEPEGKVLLRFGRNHLHRGYDARGISTLGNFVVEWAHAENKSVVNVGVFAAGGKEHLARETFDADERQDEPTFALLADLAGKTPTIFDLRVLRPMLHSIAAEKRNPLEANLIYWADSYDFLLCYPLVSPLAD